MATDYVSSPAEARRIVAELRRKTASGGLNIFSGLKPSLIGISDFMDAGYSREDILQTCIPKNLFTWDEPKQFYVVRNGVVEV